MQNDKVEKSGYVCIATLIHSTCPGKVVVPTSQLCLKVGLWKTVCFCAKDNGSIQA